MPINVIPNGIEAPQIQGPLDLQAKSVQLKSLLGQNQMQDMQIQQAKQQQADAQAQTKALHEWDGNDLNTLPHLVLKNGGSSNAVFATVKHIAEQGIAAGKKTELDLKNSATKTDLLLGHINSALELDDEHLQQGVIATVKDDAQQGLVDPQHAQAMIQAALSATNPKQIRDGVSIIAKSLKGQKLIFDQTMKERETAAREDSANKPTQASLAVAAAGGDKAAQAALDKIAEQKPDRADTEITIAQKAAAGDPKAIATQKELNRQAISRSAGEAAARTKATLAATGGLTPEALDMNAQRFLQTGQMPTGLRNPALTKQIMNRAGELGAGTSLAANSASFKANQESYKQVTGTLDTLTAFENVGMKNLDNFLNLAQKIPDTGVPWLNKPVRSLSKDVVGDTNMPAINAARTVALREIARITNDPKLKGVLTDSARQEVEGLIPENATLPQIVAVAKVLKQDVANVRTSVEAQKQAIGERLGIKGTAQSQQQDNTPGGKEIHYKVVNGQLVAQ